MTACAPHTRVTVCVVQRCPADPVLPFLPSLRVNLDMGKMVYSWMIRRDSKIPGTVVRSSTIPEQLGRISYLLTDKTGEYLCMGAGGFQSAPALPLEVGEGVAAVFLPHCWTERECLVMSSDPCMLPSPPPLPIPVQC